MPIERPGYPLFLLLSGRKVLVVGGGAVAREKTIALREAGARVTVVAPEIDPELAALADSAVRREVTAEDVDGAWLVIAAATPEVNWFVKAAADDRRVFVVAVDDVASCSAIGAAQLRKGGLTVAISSSGRAPALVALLRRALERLIPDETEAWVALAEDARKAWKASRVPIADRRPLLLEALNAMYRGGEAP
jgi:siroheme synthase-like protein